MLDDDSCPVPSHKTFNLQCKNFQYNWQLFDVKYIGRKNFPGKSGPSSGILCWKNAFIAKTLLYITLFNTFVAPLEKV
jgi:hypothetical protein